MSETNLYPGLNLGSGHGDAHERAERTVFGFWVFLMSDLIIFGILFASYASYLGPIGMAGGPGPQDLFDMKSVAIQTAFLSYYGSWMEVQSQCMSNCFFSPLTIGEDKFIQA